MVNSLLNEDWCRQLASYQNLFVGFSGGLDSTVLLYSLISVPVLKKKLRAVHVHHGLSQNADDWQTHCQQICTQFSIPLIIRKVELTVRTNLEENARIARYDVFAELMSDNDCLVLGHHANDQAETILLQLLRGAGVDGLSAMAPLKPFVKGKLARPLLQHKRELLENYAKHYQLTWVEDESNQCITLSRNYLRHQIIPLLQVKWPAVVTNLARSAAHSQQAKDNLETLAEIDYVFLKAQNDKLSIEPLLTLDKARITNVLQVWLKNNQARRPSAVILKQIIHNVIFSRIDSMPIVRWGNWAICRYQQDIYLLNNDVFISQSTSIKWFDFPKPLLYGQMGRKSLHLVASQAEKGLCVKPGQKLQIRFREGGELFNWRGQTKQLKKLLQEWKIPPWQREQIPLIYINDSLAMVVGFAVSDLYYGESKQDIYQIDFNITL